MKYNAFSLRGNLLADVTIKCKARDESEENQGHNSGDLLNNDYKLLILKKWKTAGNYFPIWTHLKESTLNLKFWLKEWISVNSLTYNVHLIRDPLPMNNNGFCIFWIVIQRNKF